MRKVCLFPNTSVNFQSALSSISLLSLFGDISGNIAISIHWSGHMQQGNWVLRTRQSSFRISGMSYCFNQTVFKREETIFTTIPCFTSTTSSIDNIYRPRYCEGCHTIRPSKASHCRLCDHCVRVFDQYVIFNSSCPYFFL